MPQNSFQIGIVNFSVVIVAFSIITLIVLLFHGSLAWF